MKTRKKKYRLKQWVKDALMILAIGLIFGVLFVVAIKSYGKSARECDEYYGRTCSIYEIDQYGKGIRR